MNRSAGGVVTGLVRRRGRRGRVDVFLDGEYGFSLAELLAASLRKGAVLSGPEIEALLEQERIHAAYEDGLRFLGYRPRSSAEMAAYLSRRGHPKPLIEQTLTRLRREKYLDDAGFARLWVSDRMRLRPRGTRGLRHELRQKGISEGDIAAALEDLDELGAAWEAVQRKLRAWKGLAPQQLKRRAYGFLQRRGFDQETTLEVCRRVSAALRPGLESEDGGSQE